MLSVCGSLGPLEGERLGLSKRSSILLGCLYLFMDGLQNEGIARALLQGAVTQSRQKKSRPICIGLQKIQQVARGRLDVKLGKLK